MKISTTTVTQTANEILGTKEKKLYYLIIQTDRYETDNEKTEREKLVINVGEKTHNKVKELMNNDF